MKTVYTPAGGSETTEKRQHNALNELLKFANTLVAYDHGNNAASSDPNVQRRGNGNISDDGTRLYEYDALNRLSRVKRKSDSATVAEYAYDAMGRRVRKVVSNGGVPNDSALNGTTDYLYSQEQCVEERNGSNATTRQYVWGIYVDELIQTGVGVSMYYPLQDLLYRTTALTNLSGTIVEAYDTDAYGNTLTYSAAGTGGNWWANDATQSSNPACQYIFTGRQYDPETMIYFYRARYYHPTLGRFLSRDLIDYEDSMNLYEYARGNPVENVDSSGKAAAAIGIPLVTLILIAILLGITLQKLIELILAGEISISLPDCKIQPKSNQCILIKISTDPDGTQWCRYQCPKYQALVSFGHPPCPQTINEPW
jgi:RHS repeat-associated protein